MKCEVCGVGMESGASFHRQNEKGVKGIWRCMKCNTLPLDIHIQYIVDVLNAK